MCGLVNKETKYLVTQSHKEKYTIQPIKIEQSSSPEARNVCDQLIDHKRTNGNTARLRGESRCRQASGAKNSRVLKQIGHK